MIKIKTALISVTDKTGIVDFAKFLASQGVKLVSTGGTAKAIADAGVAVTDISEVTGFPEIMDGRVKTLHPKVHGGLLAVRDNAEHVDAMNKHEIGTIDMVVVNLYEFEKTVESGAADEHIIENIDIGGPSMIRSAAKNHKFVAVVTDPADYAVLQKEIAEQGGVKEETAKHLAAKAFSRTAAYDSAISNWFMRESGEQINITGKLKQTLRYGENPHQKAAFYVTDGSGISGAQQLQGKELSYNNINDTDAAWNLVAEFAPALYGKAVAIIKHANPCGVAIGATLKEAYMKAFEADSTSAFGGIVALNSEIDAATAEEIVKIFTEVIIAPKVSKEALEIFAGKKNLRVLTAEFPKPAKQVKTVSGGLLVQDFDSADVVEKDLEVVTKNKPSKEQIIDMLFANKVVKHVKSNAIVVAHKGVTTGIGAGQMNRVGSVDLATAKDVRGHVLASDAFLPFADNVELAHKAGIAAIIQPGGSVRDEEVIDAANAYGICMALTGVRVFKH